MTLSSSRAEGLAITSDDLLVVLADLWEATFSCAIAEAAASPDPATAWWAAVDLIDGEGKGVVAEVVMVVDEPALAAVARLTFGADEPATDHMIEVAAEAANILGGNVKGILARRTRLSSPRAGRGVPPLGPGPRTSVHAVDDRGRRMEVHVIHTSGTAPGGASRNEARR
ncbi:MAG: hypothetical protein R2761_08825 [Acidimicrobiales bacterium]